VGLRSKTHAVLATLKRSSSELASYQQKIFKIDNHIGIAIAGLTAVPILSPHSARTTVNVSMPSLSILDP